MRKLLEISEKYLFYLIVFFLPLFFLPSFANPWGASKVALLATGVGLLILIKALIVIADGKLEIKVGQFDFVVFLGLLTYLVSGLLKTPNKMEAFFLPGTATVVVGGVILYFFANSVAKKTTLKKVLFFSAVLVSLIAILATLGVLGKAAFLPSFVQSQYFTTLGISTLPLIAFLLVSLPLGIASAINEKEIVQKVFLGVCSLIVLVGLVIGITNALPGKETSPRLVDYTTSWQVAVESLKTSPILGVGPGNYLTAFNRFRPLSFNQTDNWNLRFASARSYYLTVVSETGLLGLAFIVLLFVSLFRVIKEKGLGKALGEEGVVSLLALLVFFVLFPTETTLVALLFLLLFLVGSPKALTFNLSSQESPSLSGRLPALFLGIPVITLILVFYYFSGRALLAEAKYMNSLSALSRNQGTETYNLVRQAIALNPLVDRYHTTNAQVNMALAQAIANKESVTEADRATITQLISQAINEAKSAASLNRQRSPNWEILARTYQSIMAFAQGADAFAIQSFSQAVVLDPVNPNLRIALGGVYFATGDFETAVDVFKLAVLAKPDLANAHYNLAIAYKESGNIQKAIDEMTLTLSLVEKDSGDYLTAKAELEALEARKSETPEGSENLTPPEGSEPVIEPPIELPSDSQPPGTQGD